jgi:F-type H+-transporting ATPase subunit delta
MIENLIGKRYAEALSGNVADDSRLSAVLESLRSFVQTIESDANLVRFFSHPGIAKEKKSALVTELCERFRVDAAVGKLVQLLIERNKILFLGVITEFFEKVADDRLGQVRASVVSAMELSEENTGRLRAELSRIMDKNVLIETRVDETLLGGIRLSVGDQVADATLKNRLALLKRQIETEEVG